MQLRETKWVNQNYHCSLTARLAEGLEGFQPVRHLVEVGLFQNDPRDAPQGLDVVLQHVKTLIVHLRLEIYRRTLAWGNNTINLILTNDIKLRANI